LPYLACNRVEGVYGGLQSSGSIFAVVKVLAELYEPDSRDSYLQSVDHQSKLRIRDRASKGQYEVAGYARMANASVCSTKHIEVDPKRQK
jgi:hypothetical protein